MSIESLRPSRRVVLAALFVFLGAFVSACSAPRQHTAASAKPTGPIHLVVLHTNDLHGQVLPRKAICSTVRIPTTGATVLWFQPVRLVNACGLRIAFVGLLTTSTPSITHKGGSKFLFENPVDAIACAKAELAGKYDLLIPVGHLGL